MKLWRLTRYTKARRTRSPIPIKASQFTASDSHCLQPRPERVKKPRPCSLSRSHPPQSGPKYPFEMSQVRILDDSYKHDSSLKQVYVFVDSSRGLVELKSYHVVSSSLRMPPEHCAPRDGQLMHVAVLFTIGLERYSPLAQALQIMRPEPSSMTWPSSQNSHSEAVYLIPVTMLNGHSMQVVDFSSAANFPRPQSVHVVLVP